jgi:hypothetical protein
MPRRFARQSETAPGASGQTRDCRAEHQGSVLGNWYFKNPEIPESLGILAENENGKIVLYLRLNSRHFRNSRIQTASGFHAISISWLPSWHFPTAPQLLLPAGVGYGIFGT